MKTTSPARRSGLKATQCTTFVDNKNGERVRCRHSVLPGTESCSAGHKNTNRLVPVADGRVPISGVSVLDGTLSAEDLPGFLASGDTAAENATNERRSSNAQADRARILSRRAAQVAVGAFALGTATLLIGL